MTSGRIAGKSVDSYVYRYAAGLAVVTAYYNPAGFRSRRRNYACFAKALKQSGIPLVTVECAFGDQPYDLPESVDVVRVRSKSVLWQKERLLNLAIRWLPPTCRYVAWLDSDLLFTNQNWARDTVDLLQEVELVQVFETCNRLPQDTDVGGQRCRSFASVVTENPAALQAERFEEHGHTGYGWAASRALLETHGLYEHAIAGSADHYMAHAALGDLDSACIERMMRGSALLVEHFRDWAKPFHGSVRGRLRAVPGEVLHLWHGDLENRRYFLRHLELADLKFNPYTDLIARPGRPLELAGDRPELAEWFQSYFASRQEDGVVPARQESAWL